MKINKQYYWLGLGALIVLGLVGYFNQNSNSKEVKLGVIAGTTGAYAAAGEGYMKGFNLAMEEWNKTHELKFNDVVEDDGFNAVKGLAAYQKLKSFDKPDAYAIVSSFTIDATSDLLHTEGKPVALGFEQSKPAEADNIYQILPSAKPVQFSLGEKAKSLGYKNAVVAVSNNSPVYQNFYAGFTEGYGNAPEFKINSDNSQISTQAIAMLKSKPDVVVIYMVPKDGALLVREILKLTTKENRPFFVFDQSIQSGLPDYTKILGADFSKIDNSIVAMSRNDLSTNFSQMYKAKYNEVPPFGADMGYNSFTLLASTYDKSSVNWIDNMQKAKVAGADGEFTFNKEGLRMPDVVFAKLVNGQVIQ